MNRSQRLDRIDALRAVAMLWMTAFHFCFDLDHFGLIAQDFHHDPFWTWQRSAIVSLFLFTAGLSQAVALHQGQGWARFWRRWAQVAGAALLVSAGSALMFPKTFIYFGVLHGIAVMLVVVRLTAGWGVWLWPLGALAVAAKFIAPLAIAALPVLEILNTPGPNVLGFVSRLPVTEDYVPLLPWFGVLLAGLAAGLWVLQRRRAWLAGPLPPPLQPLAVLGRWSLSFYMLHQPVFFGLLMGWLALRR